MMIDQSGKTEYGGPTPKCLKTLSDDRADYYFAFKLDYSRFWLTIGSFLHLFLVKLETR